MTMVEGVNDPYVLKAVFTAGGGGSGKSFVAGTMFAGMGLRVVNSDVHFERAMKSAGLDFKTHMSSAHVQKTIRPRVKVLTSKQADVWIRQRLGLVVDTTAAKPAKVFRQAGQLQGLGYDTYMVFVDVPLEVALARNAQRDRTVPVEDVKADHAAVQKAKSAFRAFFGGGYREIDNSHGLTPDEIKRELVPKLHRVAMSLIGGSVHNPLGRAWIEAQHAERKAGGRTPDRFSLNLLQASIGLEEAAAWSDPSVVPMGYGRGDAGGHGPVSYTPLRDRTLKPKPVREAQNDAQRILERIRTDGKQAPGRPRTRGRVGGIRSDAPYLRGPPAVFSDVVDEED
jgi:cytidylate kinase